MSIAQEGLHISKASWIPSPGKQGFLAAPQLCPSDQRAWEPPCCYSQGHRVPKWWGDGTVMVNQGRLEARCGRLVFLIGPGMSWEDRPHSSEALWGSLDQWR